MADLAIPGIVGKTYPNIPLPTPRPEIIEKTEKWWNFPLFGNNDGITAHTDSGMPLGSTEKPAGALFSEGGTHIAPDIQIDLLSLPRGLDLVKVKFMNFYGYISDFTTSIDYRQVGLILALMAIFTGLGFLAYGALVLTGKILKKFL